MLKPWLRRRDQLKRRPTPIRRLRPRRTVAIRKLNDRNPCTITQFDLLPSIRQTVRPVRTSHHHSRIPNRKRCRIPDHHRRPASRKAVPNRKIKIDPLRETHVRQLNRRARYVRQLDELEILLRPCRVPPGIRHFICHQRSRIVVDLIDPQRRRKRRHIRRRRRKLHRLRPVRPPPSAVLVPHPRPIRPPHPQHTRRNPHLRQIRRPRRRQFRRTPHILNLINPRARRIIKRNPRRRNLPNPPLHRCNRITLRIPVITAPHNHRVDRKTRSPRVRNLRLVRIKHIVRSTQLLQRIPVHRIPGRPRRRQIPDRCPRIRIRRPIRIPSVKRLPLKVLVSIPPLAVHIRIRTSPARTRTRTRRPTRPRRRRRKRVRRVIPHPPDNPLVIRKSIPVRVRQIPHPRRRLHRATQSAPRPIQIQRPEKIPAVTRLPRVRPAPRRARMQVPHVRIHIRPRQRLTSRIDHLRILINKLRNMPPGRSRIRRQQSQQLPAPVPVLQRQHRMPHDRYDRIRRTSHHHPVDRPTPVMPRNELHVVIIPHDLPVPSRIRRIQYLRTVIEPIVVSRSHIDIPNQPVQPKVCVQIIQIQIPAIPRLSLPSLHQRRPEIVPVRRIQRLPRSLVLLVPVVPLNRINVARRQLALPDEVPLRRLQHHIKPPEIRRILPVHRPPSRRIRHIRPRRRSLRRLPDDPEMRIVRPQRIHPRQLKNPIGCRHLNPRRPTMHRRPRRRIRIQPERIPRLAVLAPPVVPRLEIPRPVELERQLVLPTHPRRPNPTHVERDVIVHFALINKRPPVRRAVRRPSVKTCRHIRVQCNQMIGLDAADQ